MFLVGHSFSPYSLYLGTDEEERGKFILLKNI